MRVETIGDCTLYCGDCLDVLPTLGQVDAVVTDPPYGIEANKANAHSSIRDNPAWAEGTWDDSRPAHTTFDKLLTLSSRMAVWGGNYFADLLPASSGWLVWRKPEAETGFSLADAELCWTNSSFAVRTKTFLRRDGNDHPTQKPVVIMQWVLDALLVPNSATVLDPFMGSGTTGVACVKTGRRFIGIEIDEGYYSIAVKRITEAYQQPRLPFSETSEQATQPPFLCLP